MSYSNFNLFKPQGYRPLTLDELDRMPGLHHSAGKKRTKQTSSANKRQKQGKEKVERAASDGIKEKTNGRSADCDRTIKECGSCHKKYSVKFQSKVSEKADYVCRKCLSENEEKA